MNYTCLNLVLFMAFLQDMFSFIIYFAIPIFRAAFYAHSASKNMYDQHVNVCCAIANHFVKVSV